VGFAPGPDSLSLDPYHLLQVGVVGHTMKLRVGYSGCGPDQPFQLFMVGGFMESNPLQARLLLSHVGGQLCDAYFEADLAYDLSPILRESGGAMVRLRFEDATGAVHTFDLNP